MADFQIHGKLRKVGNSLAILIPAKVAREANLAAGQTVDGTLRTDLPPILGFLKHQGVPHVAFDRKKDMGYRDRI